LESAYKDAVRSDVAQCLIEKSGQPILFLGSGVSRRYFGAPDWPGLLRQMSKICPLIPHEFAYYEQSFPSLRHIGQEFATKFREWAWGDGRANFPEEYFDSSYSQEIFLKHKVAEYLDSITPSEPSLSGDDSLSQELRLLQAIRPHAIVTTNYDVFLERLFPEYQPIIGQKILSSESAFFGEIFKIHGCVTQPRTLVLTQSDYDDFSLKKKYLSAKLLTFFLEHPVLFVGYRAEDPNISAILSDIDIILSTEGALIPNIFLLQRPRRGRSEAYPPREELVPVADDRRARIRTIVADDFTWVFDSFAIQGSMERIRPKLLRGLLARTYDLVRHDIPKRTLEVDYTVLERAVQDEGELANVYGITVVGDATHVNVGYPLSLTAVAKELGFDRWHGANRLLDTVKDLTGVDLKASDNKYHVAVKAGEKAVIHKYSPHAVDLLRGVKKDPKAAIRLEGYQRNPSEEVPTPVSDSEE
jgi:hypothetical protein